MTQFAGRDQTTDIVLAPGEARSYRLPTMTRGEFLVRATRLHVPSPIPPGGFPQPPGLVPGDPGVPGGGLPTLPPVLRPAPAVPERPGRPTTVLLSRMRPGLVDLSGGRIAIPPGVPPVPPVGPAGGDIVTDLFHGDQLVQSTAGLLVQTTPSDSDSTWRLRVQLAPGSPEGETYHYQIYVMYPSILPILTRRIPLGFFRQGFDDNWNGRNYVYLNINANKIFIQFDEELAWYYKLKENIIDLDLPYITINNIRTKDIRLDVGAADNPFSFIHGYAPFFQLTVGFTRDTPGAPISVEGPFFSSLELSDFEFRFKFFLAAFGELRYVTKFESPLLDQVPESFRDPRSLEEIYPRKMIEDAVEKKLDSYGYIVGAVLRTWLLGADFDVWNVRYDPATDEIVVDYVGQEFLESESVTAISPGGPVPPPIMDPPLNTDPLYTPRGAGDSIWKPRRRSGVLLGTEGLPHSVGPATTPGDLSKVDHIVVVMMENRSFDHMLGFLSRDNGRSDIEGLRQETGDNRTQFNYYNGRYYYPEKLTNTRILDSPHHGHETIKGQMADGMMHFVSDYARIVGDDPGTLRLVMGYYGGDALRTYAMLAEEYAVCDHWFSSHVGPTIPNRFVLLTGDLNRNSWGEPEVDTPDYKTFTPSETDTLFDHLSSRGVSWKYFQHRASMMRVFTKYTFDMTNVLEFDDPVWGFQQTVASGELPSVMFVDPAFGDLPAGVGQIPDNDDAPPADLLDGQAFISTVVQTLLDPQRNPRWGKTMLIIVYDEHGGFYDHVDPPSNFVPLLGQNSGKLGPRVPAFVVSPWTPRRTVLKDVFEHGSIPATILRRFCSPHPPSMGPRVAAALDLRGALSLTRARGGVIAPLSVAGSMMETRRRVAAPRRFVAPTNPDDFGAFLGGVLLTSGTAPR